MASESTPLYLRYSRERVATTQTYAGGDVNVDLDRDGRVVGIEMLGRTPDLIGHVASLAATFGLRQLPETAARN